MLSAVFIFCVLTRKRNDHTIRKYEDYVKVTVSYVPFDVFNAVAYTTFVIR